MRSVRWGCNKELENGIVLEGFSGDNVLMELW